MIGRDPRTVRPDASAPLAVGERSSLYASPRMKAALEFAMRSSDESTVYQVDGEGPFV